MIKSISRSGHVVAQKENNYIVEGDLPPELLEALFNLVESWTCKDEVRDKIATENATEEEAINLINLFDEWVPNPSEPYKKGKRLKHMVDGVLTLFETYSDIPKGETREPQLLPTLYKDLTGHQQGDTPRPWVQMRPPNGYDLKEKCIHIGWIWESTYEQGKNCWEPGAQGTEQVWKKIRPVEV